MGAYAPVESVGDRRSGLAFRDPDTGRPLYLVPTGVTRLYDPLVHGSGVAMEEREHSPLEVPLHQCPTLRLILCLSGETTVELKHDGRWRATPFHRGLFNLFPSNAACEIRWPRRIKVLDVALDPVVLGPEAVVGTSEIRFSMAQSDEFAVRLARTLHDELRSGSPQGRLFREELGQSLMGHLVRSHGGRWGPPPPGRLDQRSLRRVVEMIDVQLGGDLSVSRLARETGYSPWHFGRLFKASTGEGVHAYVVRRRVERARSMLQKGLPPEVVAAVVGFADPSHLSRWCVRLLRTTPNALRRIARIDNDPVDLGT